LYAGDAPTVTAAYGPQATPHVFIFDRSRRLRYQGHFDNSYRIEKVKTHDAQDAIDALLAGTEITVTHTGVFGCSTKWPEKTAQREAAERKIDAEPVIRESGCCGFEETARKSERACNLDRLLGTWCGSCLVSFPTCRTPTACTAVAISTW